MRKFRQIQRGDFIQNNRRSDINTDAEKDAGLCPTVGNRSMFGENYQTRIPCKERGGGVVH